MKTFIGKTEGCYTFDENIKAEHVVEQLRSEIDRLEYINSVYLDMINVHKRFFVKGGNIEQCKQVDKMPSSLRRGSIAVRQRWRKRR